MKLMIASDIHGCAPACKALLEAFAASGAERLILLGDILYHGPRNRLPDGYDPRAVISMLSDVSDKLFCVRGNCDTEVDQMVLPFPHPLGYCPFVRGWQNLVCLPRSPKRGQSHGGRSAGTPCRERRFVGTHPYPCAGDYRGRLDPPQSRLHLHTQGRLPRLLRPL